MDPVFYGTSDPLPTRRTLRAGALTMILENGALRQLRHRGREVLRNVYFALRDENWGTYRPLISDENIKQETDAFSVAFDCRYERAGVPVFRWQVRIRGDAQGRLDFEIEGTALQTLLRNRAGFCVLHPVEECAGRPLRITTPDGRIEAAVFPKNIAPTRPFPYIRAMTWSPNPDIEALLTFEGDDFETEDHRNWTDTSYKTFCTPLHRPFPVEIAAGTVVRQALRLRWNKPMPLEQASATVAEAPFALLETAGRHPMPALGFLHDAGESMAESPAVYDLLRALNPDHLRFEVDLTNPDGLLQLRRAQEIASGNGVKTFLSLTFPKFSHQYFRTILKKIAAEKSWGGVGHLMLHEKGAYATSSDLIAATVPVLRAVFPGFRLGAGTQTNYAELGRHVFDASGLDFIAYGIQPQEHGFDLLTLTENMESQGDTVHSARALYPDKAVYASPLTLRRRFNPYAADKNAHFTELPAEAQADPRLDSLYGAGWALGSVKALAEAGADLITAFRSVGGNGLIARGNEVKPLYFVLKWIQAFAGGTVWVTRSADKLQYSSLFLEKGGMLRRMVANHTAGHLEIALPDPGLRRVYMIEATNIGAWKRGEEKPVEVSGILTLSPFAVAMWDARL
jgi:D-apionolactonase